MGRQFDFRWGTFLVRLAIERHLVVPLRIPSPWISRPVSGSSVHPIGTGLIVAVLEIDRALHH